MLVLLQMEPLYQRKVIVQWENVARSPREETGSIVVATTSGMSHTGVVFEQVILGTSSYSTHSPNNIKQSICTLCIHYLYGYVDIQYTYWYG